MVRTESQTQLVDQVLATFQNTPGPRLREIVEAGVRHLHALADEVKLTREEWLVAVRFLTAVGKFATDERQEMILLSDVLGLSSLVEMLDFRGAAGSTENTVLGPFYIPGAPQRSNGDSIVDTELGGEPLVVSGTVRSLDGRPLAGATVDIWESAANGLYCQQDDDQSPTNLRGVFTTDADGRYEFVTTRPTPYSVPTDGPVGRFLDATGRHAMRAAHIHFIVSAPDHHSLTTHIFDRESKYLDSDAVFGVRDSLIVDFEPAPDGRATALFDITLTPAG